MNWTKQDKALFSIVNQSGNYHLEKQIQEASEIFFTLKKRPEYYIIFGYYNLDQNIFVWQNGMNLFSEKIVKRDHMDIFKTDLTINKLFENKVKFDPKDMNVIPYLMEALNEGFNVIRIKSKTDYIYALTIVENTKRTFNLTIFEDALIFYRKWEQVEEFNNKKNKLKKKYRETQKQFEKDVSECKENLI